MPVIASHMGGIPELIEDGTNGLLFEAGDSRALAGAMARLCDRAAVDALRGGIKAVKSIADNCREYEQLYETAISGREGTPPAPQTSPVHAIVLNYNTPGDAVRCIASLAAAPHVLLVDNGSDDDSAAAVRGEHPEIEILETGENLGCAGGYNAGLRWAREQGAAFCLLLNADVTLAPDALEKMLAAARAEPQAAIFGARVCEMQRPDRIESAGSRYDPETGRARQIGSGEVDRGQYDGVREVDGVLGCAMLVRMEAVEEIGLLAEEFFCYFEETDWCLRASACGWQVLVVGDAKVLHGRWGSTGGRQPAAAIYYGVRNQLMTVGRHNAGGGGLRRFWRQAGVALYALAYLLLRSRVPKAAGLAQYLRGLRDYYLGRDGRLRT